MSSDRPYVTDPDEDVIEKEPDTYVVRRLVNESENVANCCVTPTDNHALLHVDINKLLR